jgi:Uma2 family endonuclease
MTASVLLTKPSAPESDQPALRRFSLDEYHEMIEAGVFVRGPRCELIRGVILEKPVPGPSHSRATQRLLRKLVPFFPEAEWVVGIQDAITLADSEPEPDFFAARGPDARYAERHPGPKDLLLVVEVSDSSLGYDRGTKQELYAEAKVPQYWIVNVSEKRVEVYTDPKGGKAPAYRTRTDYTGTDSVPVVVAGRALGSIAVKDLLPAGANA